VEPEVRLELRVPLSLREALRDEAAGRHCSLNAYVVGLLLGRGEPLWTELVWTPGVLVLRRRPAAAGPDP
jgi:hypothetical protein